MSSVDDLYRRAVRPALPCGNIGAWSALYRMHRHPVVAWLEGNGADRASAEDAVQTAFLRLMTQRPEIAGSFGGYLRHAARNALVTAFRERGRESTALRVRELASSEESELPETRVEHSRAQSALARAVTTLPASQRRLLVLRGRGLSLRECRERLGWTCSLSTCKRRLDKAIYSVRRRLREKS